MEGSVQHDVLQGKGGLRWDRKTERDSGGVAERGREGQRERHIEEKWKRGKV